MKYMDKKFSVTAIPTAAYRDEFDRIFNKRKRMLEAVKNAEALEEKKKEDKP